MKNPVGFKNFEDDSVRRVTKRRHVSHILLTASTSPSTIYWSVAFPAKTTLWQNGSGELGIKAKRGNLEWTLRILRWKRPLENVLLENVPDFSTHQPARGLNFAIILNDFSMGYEVEWRVINADYGMPQQRSRVFISHTHAGKRQEKEGKNQRSQKFGFWSTKGPENPQRLKMASRNHHQNLESGRLVRSQSVSEQEIGRRPRSQDAGLPKPSPFGNGYAWKNRTGSVEEFLVRSEG